MILRPGIRMRMILCFSRDLARIKLGHRPGSVPLALNNELAPIFAAEMKKFNLIEDQNKLMPVGEGNFYWLDK